MRIRHYMADLLAPLIRRLPRGKRVVCRWLGATGFNNPNWRDAPRRRRMFYDKTLKAWVYVDIGDWSGRMHYLYGYFFDRENRLLIDHWLGPGDTYIDVGANYGFHSLYAARRVSPGGRVISFEPNPRIYELLRAHLAINHIENCTALNVGLSDEPGELTLASPSDHPGAMTFRQLDQTEMAVKVPVRVGDEALSEYDLTGKVLIKIDTEGFEHHVIKGLPRLLERSNVALSIEVTDEWLRATGSGAAELFADLMGRGYKPYHMQLRHRGWTTPVLHLEPIDRPLDRRQFDVFFARE